MCWCSRSAHAPTVCIRRNRLAPIPWPCFERSPSLLIKRIFKIARRLIGHMQSVPVPIHARAFPTFSRVFSHAQFQSVALGPKTPITASILHIHSCDRQQPFIQFSKNATDRGCLSLKLLHPFRAVVSPHAFSQQWFTCRIGTKLLPIGRTAFRSG